MKYFSWHYFEILPKLFKLARNLFLFPLYMFSVPLHISTFFSPWKKQYVQKRPGFHLDDIFSVVSFNTISRVIGAILRSILILLGVFFGILSLGFGIFLVFLWTVLPLITIPLYLTRKKTDKEEAQNLFNNHKNNINSLCISLFQSKEGSFISKRLGLDRESIIKKLRMLPPSPVSNSNLSINGIVDLWILTVENCSFFMEVLSSQSLDLDDVKETALWYEKKEKIIKKPLILDFDAICGLKGFGSDWPYAYTPNLDKYAKDLTNVQTSFPLLIGREKELELMEQMLLKTAGNDILVVGEAGTSRHLTVQTFALRILSGSCSRQLSHKRVLQLDMTKILSGQANPIDAKEFFKNLINEAEFAGNIILVIDDFDKYVDNENGHSDLSDVLYEMSQSKIEVIGITSSSSYHKSIEPHKEFVTSFEKIEINPPNHETLLSILELSIVPVLEEKYRCVITFPALRQTIELSERYITTGEFPDKAIELLQDACVFALSQKKYVITVGHIQKIIEQKYHIISGVVGENEKEKLLRLEDLLHLRVINQEMAISSLANSLRRSRLNIASTNKPIGTFLFLGPTGVGKTETAKALASVYFGNENELLRFDMSEYQKDEGLSRLIGSQQFNTPGELTSKLLEHPAGVLLLDEVEKASPDILNLFLTLIDEGYITDHTGKKINAKNCIIIATSNAGAEFIRQSLESSMPKERLESQVLEYIQTSQIFTPEFLNRFDKVVVFTPLSEGHLRDIAKMILTDLNKRLIPKNISVAVTPRLITSLANMGYHPERGAREIKRVITEIVEDTVAKRLLSPDHKKGEILQIEV